MNVSTPEVTMMDLVSFARRSGGISHVATVLDELVESVNSADLKKLIAKNNEPTWLQRLGFLLEQLGHHELSEIIYQRIKKQKMQLVPLVPYHSITGTERNSKWQIAINTIIESDVHDTD